MIKKQTEREIKEETQKSKEDERGKLRSSGFESRNEQGAATAERHWWVERSSGQWGRRP